VSSSRRCIGALKPVSPGGSRARLLSPFARTRTHHEDRDGSNPVNLPRRGDLPVDKRDKEKKTERTTRAMSFTERARLPRRFSHFFPLFVPVRFLIVAVNARVTVKIPDIRQAHRSRSPRMFIKTPGTRADEMGIPRLFKNKGKHTICISVLRVDMNIQPP